jgi:hypothetical protein
MVIIETSIFTRRIKSLMSDELYRKVQSELATRPDAGDLIEQSGGLRKYRARLTGKGKRGGARIIYYWHKKRNQIFMLMVFAKNEQDNLTKAQLDKLRKIIEE